MLRKGEFCRGSRRDAAGRFSGGRSIVEKRTHSTVSVENLDPKTVDQFIKTEHYFVVNDLPQIPPETEPLTQAKTAANRRSPGMHRCRAGIGGSCEGI